MMITNITMMMMMILVLFEGFASRPCMEHYLRLGITTFSNWFASDVSAIGPQQIWYYKKHVRALDCTLIAANITVRGLDPHGSVNISTSFALLQSSGADWWRVPSRVFAGIFLDGASDCGNSKWLQLTISLASRMQQMGFPHKFGVLTCFYFASFFIRSQNRNEISVSVLR
jgi:hypothetical protein